MNVDTELAFFCLLVKQGSLAATARELNLTPPAVSRRLSQLEDRLGVRLLNRTTRRINLTSEGEVYFQHAQRILSDIEDLCDRIGIVHRGRMLYCGGLAEFLAGDGHLEERFVELIWEADLARAA